MGTKIISDIWRGKIPRICLLNPTAMRGDRIRCLRGTLPTENRVPQNNARLEQLIRDAGARKPASNTVRFRRLNCEYENRDSNGSFGVNL